MLTLKGTFNLRDPDDFTPANHLVTPVHIQPEWYFVFPYGILRSITKKLGGVIALQRKQYASNCQEISNVSLSLINSKWINLFTSDWWNIAVMLNCKAVFTGRDTKTASVCYTGYHVTLCCNFWITLLVLCLFLARELPVGQGLLIHEVSRSHTKTHHSR